MDDDAGDPLPDWKQVFEAIGDEWSRAFRSMLKVDGSNPKPLAVLLRSGKEIPTHVGDALAELLDPGDSDYLGFEFKPEKIRNNRHKKVDSRRPNVHLYYSAMRSSGKTAEEAAELTAEKFGISDRQVYDDVKNEKELIKQRQLGQMSEEWNFSFRSMLNFQCSDPKPLAALLRSGSPIPANVGWSLAELIDPGRHGYQGFRLVLKETKTNRQKIHELRQPAVYAYYNSLRDEGCSIIVAAEKTAEKFGISPRTVHVDHRAEEGRILRQLGGGDDAKKALAVLRKGQFSLQ